MTYGASSPLLIADLDVQLHWSALPWDVFVNDPYIGDGRILYTRVDPDAKVEGNLLCVQLQLSTRRLALHLHVHLRRLVNDSNLQESSYEENAHN